MISRLLRSLLEHWSRAEMRDENARIGTGITENGRFRAPDTAGAELSQLLPVTFRKAFRAVPICFLPFHQSGNLGAPRRTSAIQTRA
jgi:hypothetical protein